jgi:hypothetical protein
MNTRDQVIRENIQVIGEDSFPDDQVAWNSGEIIHKGHYSSVEAVPHPSTVGYEKFKFVLGFVDEEKFYVVGCYCWHDNEWSLLFTDPKAKDDWKKLFR